MSNRLLHIPLGRLGHPAQLGRQYCFACRTELREVDLSLAGQDAPGIFPSVHVCDQCGWWWHEIAEGYGGGDWIIRGNASCLVEFDLYDINAPLGEIRQFLTAKYSSRFGISWQLLEDTVQAVFRDLGWFVEGTVRQGDGGIDAILSKSNNQRIGVQVKRFRNKIEADQIREFVGALLLHGMTSGVFMTTSGFTRGAKQTASRAAAIGIPVELLDAPAFFELLRITSSVEFPSILEWRELLKGIEVQPYEKVGFHGSIGSRAMFINKYLKQNKIDPHIPSSRDPGTKLLKPYRGATFFYSFDAGIRMYVGVVGYADCERYVLFEREEDAEAEHHKKVDDDIRWDELLS